MNGPNGGSLEEASSTIKLTLPLLMTERDGTKSNHAGKSTLKLFTKC
jgi:hypothetical protein